MKQAGRWPRLTAMSDAFRSEGEIPGANNLARLKPPNLEEGVRLSQKMTHGNFTHRPGLDGV